ncbi:MAG: insulinase family protein [Spirochaetales bacterium]|nr:insulinase family protein [Spirochaetales bacterium]
MNFHPAYELLREADVPEYRARGVWLRHRATGCEVFRLVDETEENTFAFIFRTPSADSTGVAHIIEHSVLCGSERFPTKDPFLGMARRSLNTFLNAMTYADRTVYPAASLVEADFYNLMDVYGDAVFFPRLDEDTFLQEAWHLEYGEDGRLGRRGVVYNEMKGDYSSAESVIGTRGQATLFDPGHPYSFDSGGDPERIPELDYDAFKAFHARHYHPSNCRIFLHGNFPLERQLEFLHERFLSRFGREEEVSDVPLQAPFAAPRTAEYAFEAEPGSDARATTLLSWLVGESADQEAALSLQVLSEVLVGNDGAPLAKALRESGFGEDISPHTGTDASLRQASFSAGLRGTDPADSGRIEAFILETLGKIARDGIPEEDVEAAFDSVAFLGREIRRSGSFGLRYLGRVARGWMRGRSPFETLSFDAPLEALRARFAAEKDLVPRLVRATLLDNPHRVLLTVRPSGTLAAARREAETAAFAALDASLGDSGRESVRARAAALAGRQSRPDSPEDLARLPRLARSDIPRKVETVERHAVVAGSIHASLHPRFANGVACVDLAFPLEALPGSRAIELPLLARLLSGAGTSSRRWDAAQRELARDLGGFQAALTVGTPVGADPGAAKAFLVFRIKALRGKIARGISTVAELLADADLTDLDRMRDLFRELRNDAGSSVVPAGSAYAAARASSGFSKALGLDELWHGPSQLLLLRDLAAAACPGDGAIEELAPRLAELRSGLLRRDAARVNVCADPGEIDSVLDETLEALARLPSGPAALAERHPLRAAAPSSPREAWSLDTRVGFTAAALPSARFPAPDYAHEQVLAHLLSTGLLWDEIRVRRGAYGAHCSADGAEGVLGFGSYRDPAPRESFAVFRKALEWAASAKLGDSLAEDAVIGTAGGDIRPMTPSEASYVDFRRELYGIDDVERQAKRDALLATGAAELRNAAARLLEAWERRSQVLISSADEVESMQRDDPGTVARELPAW